MARMTDRQRRFCDEYLIDLNATQAAIRAGYSEKYANTNVTKLLQNTTIQEFISKRMAEKEDDLIAKQDEVLRFLTSVMRGESVAEIVVVEGCGKGYSKARNMQKAPDQGERLKAAELLGKRYGLYTDRVEQDVDMDLNITIDYGEDAEDGADDA